MIRVSHWNAHSLDTEKLYALSECMSEMKIDFAGVSETWYLRREEYYEAVIHGFNVVGFSEPNGRRGLATFVSPTKKFKILQQFSLKSPNLTMVTVKHYNMVIVQAYVPDGGRHDGISELVEQLEDLESIFENIVVLGDLNARLGVLPNEIPNRAGQYLKRWLETSRMERVKLDVPTFPSSASCLDHIITSCPNNVCSMFAHPMGRLSDHQMVCIDLNLEVSDRRTRPKHRTTQFWPNRQSEALTDDESKFATGWTSFAPKQHVVEALEEVPSGLEQHENRDTNTCPGNACNGCISCAMAQNHDRRRNRGSESPSLLEFRPQLQGLSASREQLGDISEWTQRVQYTHTKWTHVTDWLEKRIPSLSTEDPLELQVANFNKLYGKAVNKHTRVIDMTQKKRPRLPRDIKKLIQKRNRTKGPERKKLATEVRRRLRQHRREEWRSFCMRGVRERDGSLLWKTFRRSRGEHGISSALMQDRQDNSDVAATFTQFHVISPELVPEAPIEPLVALENLEITPIEGVLHGELKEILKKLPKKGSTGRDNVSYHVLRAAGENMTTWIANLTNESMRTGCLPPIWKEADIRALPKPSGGFRPIALLSNLCKVVERVVASRLKKFAAERNIIPANQYANKGGTQAALRGLIDYIEDAKDQDTCAVFFDVKKAFDRVHVPTLINKLTELEVPLYLVRWIYNYLSDRTCFVGRSSYVMANGVPQGSVLGPLLFQIYVSDMLTEIPKDVYNGAFADDFVVAYHAPPATRFVQNAVSNKLNKCLEKIHTECSRLGVELDLRQGKTTAMWLSNRRSKKFPKLQLKMNGQRLMFTTNYKYLGVYFDERLTFRKWITIKLENAAKRNRYVKRLKGLTKRSLRALWKGYVEAYVIYGLPEVYHLLSNEMKKKLQYFYNNSARMLSGLPRLTPGHVACLEAGIDTLEDVVRQRNTPQQGRRRRRTKLCVHIPENVANARHVEITYSRWRSGYLYTNDWRHRHNLRKSNDGMCRMCKEIEETRHHVLFECEKVDMEEREHYIAVVAEICDVVRGGVTLSHATGCSVPRLTDPEQIRLAVALTRYLDKIEYYA